ncbi:hypothetical protein GLAREA_03753 [Glarea lozoyensis ATCC 20868]|uniref:Uncharacterized protein n=1 Tax=Glarea lozoyensis (strain ATCC 20868 / MF5171) TaxID=1116229 RepID=S3DFR5_GLAL2|nr:uncharacterized protein GLAREA_03753 [Glarea lozoyensis ATCC 20868]EPE30786.1 hypothetical protein GLAREA_03753 [Glarea lozoyensis ATCC 20868]
MSTQSPPADFEVAELEKEVPEQLEVEKPNPESKDGDISNARPAQLPTPDPTLPEDYSDAPSVAPQDPSKIKRKHQRGGRKQKQQQNQQSLSEAQLLEEQERENFEEQEGRGKPALPELKHRSSNTRKATGIRTFNLKRAESSGGRAVGVSVDDSNNESKKVKNKVKPKNKSKRKVKCDKCGQKSKKKTAEENWESQDSSEESEEEEEQKPEKPKEKKPFAIRLDLNLELEIFLRAKIKGDVTITFLQ